MADQVLTGAMTPANGTAARVVAKASERNQWLPQPKPGPVTSATPLPTIQPPAGAPNVIGRRRDRMTIFGYAGHGKWVVRCDCGNYAHRKNILRWLATEAGDLCAECHNRKYLLSAPDIGFRAPKPPAKRGTHG